MFHVNFLEPAASNLPPFNNMQSFGQLFIVDGKDKYEVANIVDSQIFGKDKRL